MSERGIKVTDKRMFTAEGDLREEYRFLEEKSTATTAATAEPPAVEAAAPPPRPAPEPEPPPPASARREAEPEPMERDVRLEFPAAPPGVGPSFYDLVSVLAEPVAIYLGDLELPGGETAENLEMARFHIDLLDVLRQKTAGNLTAQENAVVEDLLYRLRVRYVQKRG